MLVVIDVGNTHTVLGFYQDDKLLENWRISTSTERTRDEYIILLQEFLRTVHVDRQAVDGMMISCVAPPVLDELRARQQRGAALPRPSLLAPHALAARELRRARSAGPHHRPRKPPRSTTWRIQSAPQNRSFIANCSRCVPALKT